MNGTSNGGRSMTAHPRNVGWRSYLPFPIPLVQCCCAHQKKRWFTMVLYRLLHVEQTYEEGCLSPSPHARTDGIAGGSSAFFLHLCRHSTSASNGF